VNRRVRCLDHAILGEKQRNPAGQPDRKAQIAARWHHHDAPARLCGAANGAVDGMAVDGFAIPLRAMVARIDDMARVIGKGQACRVDHG